MASLIDNSVVAVIAARYQVDSAPDGNTVAVFSGRHGIVRSLITYAGSVTSARLRLWLRNSRTGTWHKSYTSDDLETLAPTSGNESKDWPVGEEVEFFLTVEAIAPGTVGNTIAVDVMGV